MIHSLGRPTFRYARPFCGMKVKLRYKKVRMICQKEIRLIMLRMK